jgi:hypothetical protein
LRNSTIPRQRLQCRDQGAPGDRLALDGSAAVTLDVITNEVTRLCCVFGSETTDRLADSAR